MDSKLLEKLNKMEPQTVAEQSKLLRALFYGDFGSGKTTLAGQIVKELNLKAIIITTDSAWTVLDKDDYTRKNIIRYPFDSFGQIRLLVQAHEESIEPYSDYDVLIWDTVSTANDRMLRQLVKNPDLQKRFAADVRHPDLEGYPHYRMVANALKETVDVIKQSSMHIIYTAHIKEPTKEDTEKRVKKRFAIRPNANEMSYQVVAQEVNLLGWLYKEVKGSQNKVQFEPTLTETAKSQIPTILQKEYPTSEIPGLIKKWIMS